MKTSNPDDLKGILLDGKKIQCVVIALKSRISNLEARIKELDAPPTLGQLIFGKGLGNDDWKQREKSSNSRRIIEVETVLFFIEKRFREYLSRSLQIDASDLSSYEDTPFSENTKIKPLAEQKNMSQYIDFFYVNDLALKDKNKRDNNKTEGER
jgi:hypothetical protein